MPAPCRRFAASAPHARPRRLLGVSVLLSASLLAACGSGESTSSSSSTSSPPTPTARASGTPGPASGQVTFTLSGADSLSATWPLLPVPASPSNASLATCAVDAGSGLVVYEFDEPHTSPTDQQFIIIIAPRKAGTYKSTSARSDSPNVSTVIHDKSIWYFGPPGDSNIVVNADGRSGSFSISGPFQLASIKSPPPAGTPVASLSGTWQCNPGT